ncbi:MAG: hypothetical protein ACR2JO_06765 [Mycobacteriales bacterium]
MDLQAARELKARLLADVLTAGGAEQPTRDFAVGIAPRADGDFAVAIRLTEDVAAQEALTRLAVDSPQDIDLRVVGVIRPQTAPGVADLQSRQRPVYPGVSVGHPDVTAGTLGGFVTVDGALHALSNSHVLANSGQASVGDDALQPGVADGGQRPDDVIGTLAAFAPLAEDRPNLVDAAIAALADGIDADPARYPGGALGAVASEPPADALVQKVGRTTGLTAGRVTAFEVDGITVQYDVGVLTFDNQIEIEGDGDLPFSDGGDSGSVIWTTTDRSPFGLLFAGSTQGGSNGRGLTYANPLAVVLTELGAQWAGSDQAPVEPVPPAGPGT